MKIKMKLTANEERVYTHIKTEIIPNLKAGTYFARDFFEKADMPSCPRIVRKLYEEVTSGALRGVTLAGTRSAEGYIIS